MNPISVIENYFDIELESKYLGEFSNVKEDHWVDFCKQYWAYSKSGFSERYFGSNDVAPARVRYFFEHRFSDQWSQELAARYKPSPLLGKDHYRIDGEAATEADVSDMLTPLKKHLLLSDQVFIPDPLLKCVDFVGEVVSRNHWRTNNKADVEMAINAIQKWLPVLAHLKPLIEADALVFMPYFESPAFKGGLHGSGYNGIRDQLILKDGPAETFTGINQNEIAAAWLSGFLLGVNPVLPNRDCFEFAQRLGLRSSGLDVRSVVTNPIGLNIDVLASPDQIALKDLVKWREDEELFSDIKTLTENCKTEVASTLGPEPDAKAVERVSRDFLRESLCEYEGNDKLKWASENSLASNGISIGVGVLTAPVDGAAGLLTGLLAGLVGNPGNLRKGKLMMDKTHSAHTQLLSVL